MKTPRFHQGFTSNPLGCLYRHAKTGGVYWKVAVRHAPPALRRDGKKYLYLPMVPAGKKVATKSMGIGRACQKALWLQWQQQRKSVDDRWPETLEGWLDQFQRWNALRAAEAHTAYNRGILDRFVAHSDLREPEAISVHDIEEYLLSLKSGKPELSARTIQAHLGTIRMFCRYLLAPRGPLVLDPSHQVTVAAPALYEPRYLTTEQLVTTLEHIQAHAAPWLYDAVRLAIYAAPRRGSLEAMEKHHLGKGGLIVPLPKTRRTRASCVVPFDQPAIVGSELEQVVTEIRDRAGEGRLFPQRGRQWWCAELARLTKGLPVFGELPGRRVGNRWHLLRSTAAVTWASRGATQWQLMDWGGWTDPKTVLRYVNIAQAARG